jgi:hypothetical protein
VDRLNRQHRLRRVEPRLLLRKDVLPHQQRLGGGVPGAGWGGAGGAAVVCRPPRRPLARGSALRPLTRFSKSEPAPFRPSTPATGWPPAPAGAARRPPPRHPTMTSPPGRYSMTR